MDITIDSSIVTFVFLASYTCPKADYIMIQDEFHKHCNEKKLEQLVKEVVRQGNFIRERLVEEHCTN